LKANIVKDQSVVFSLKKKRDQLDSRKREDKTWHPDGTRRSPERQEDIFRSIFATRTLPTGETLNLALQGLCFLIIAELF
jgi:hypothetical protein